jgi:hypothetical protein
VLCAVQNGTDVGGYWRGLCAVNKGTELWGYWHVCCVLCRMGLS